MTHDEITWHGPWVADRAAADRALAVKRAWCAANGHQVLIADVEHSNDGERFRACVRYC